MINTLGQKSTDQNNYIKSFLPVIVENARLKNILYSTIAIPSFNNDSPSMIVDSCLLVPFIMNRIKIN